MSEKRDQWGSHFGMLMASAGSAVGLGNIWRFPYITGKYGGAAFFFAYLIGVAVIGLSMMTAEVAIGRAGRSDAVGSFEKLGGKKWSVPGWMGFIAAFIILSYYIVIAGWTFAYIFKSFCGLMTAASAGKAAEDFGAFVSHGWLLVGLGAVVAILTAAVVYKGIANGIERCCKILMPLLFIIVLVLVARAVTLPGAAAGIEFYLKPDFSKLTGEAVLAALGQAFYSLSVSMGILIVYGSYFQSELNIPKSVTSIAFIDTFIAVLAGLIIFPSAFAFGIEPNAGVALTFITLPGVFSQMWMGQIFSAAFFLLLFIAAMTSCIALFEVTVAFGIDRLHMERRVSTIVMLAVLIAFSVPSALSVGGHFPKIFGQDCLDFLDEITNNVIMPVAAILTSIFAGWVWHRGAKKELTNSGAIEFRLFPAWLWICRVAAPAAIAILLVNHFRS